MIKMGIEKEEQIDYFRQQIKRGKLSVKDAMKKLMGLGIEIDVEDLVNARL